MSQDTACGSHENSAKQVVALSRPWGVHTISDLYCDEVWAQVDGSRYARAVAEPYTGNRVVAAWWVLTGRAFAFQWPKPGDLEKATKLPFWDRRPSRTIIPRDQIKPSN